MPSKKAASVIDQVWVCEGLVVPHGPHRGPGTGRGGPQPRGGQMVLSCLFGRWFPQAVSELLQPYKEKFRIGEMLLIKKITMLCFKICMNFIFKK